MKTLIRMLVLAHLLVLGAVPQALAAPRTFVASFGLDANACSIIAPCRTFGAALLQTNVGGEIIVLDSAGYGPVSIDKSVSIIAPDGVYAGVTVTSGTGISVSGPNVRVTLRGLAVNGQGGVVGIRFAAGAELLIDRCTVSGMGASGIQVEGDGKVTVTRSASLRNGGDGVLVSALNPQVVLHDVRTEDNAGNGVMVIGRSARLGADGLVSARNGLTGIAVLPLLTGGTAQVTLANSQILDNVAQGAIADPDLDETVVMDATRSVFARNGGVGFGAGASNGLASLSVSDSLVQFNTTGINARSSIFLQAARNVVRGNGVGISVSGTGRVTATGNVVSRNATGIAIAPGSVFLTRGDNAVSDNFTDTSGTPTALPGF